MCCVGLWYQAQGCLLLLVLLLVLLVVLPGVS
jgi:hypothetical protein